MFERKGVNKTNTAESHVAKEKRIKKQSIYDMVSHLAIVLVYTVGHIQNPVHLHIVWIKRLLILKTRVVSRFSSVS